MRIVALALLIVAGCGADPVNPPAPDLVAMSPNGCGNGFTDGEETDQDCGGPICGPCADGKSCKIGRDCLSTFCTTGICETPSQCMNMKQDGNETDVDCGGGGECPACGDGRKCMVAMDCAGGSCIGGTCRAPLNCGGGTGDCDGDAANGCETNTQSDAKNCGLCGMACPMASPLCAAGKCVVATRVLLVHSGDASEGVEVQTNLKATGAFLAVDIARASKVVGQSPDLATLKKYDVVLFWTDSQLFDPIGLGDNLADYVDGGGRVVVALQMTDAQNLWLQGRFGNPNNGYLLIEPGKFALGADMLGAVNEKQSPLVAGVAKLSTATSCRARGQVINGGVVVAPWAGGDPLIVRGVVNGKKRVALNLCPFSAAVTPNSWTGDGAALLRNALLYQ